MENYKIKLCSCGCGKSYPKGKSKPAGWKQINCQAVKRLSDGVVFSKGDIIKRFTEEGKQYCDMIITDIDFYFKGKNHFRDSFYIRASTVKSGDRSSGSTNITDNDDDYESADNPNTFRFIQK